LGNSPSFLTLPIRLCLLDGSEVMEFRQSTSLLNYVLDRTAAERIFNFLSRIGRNSRSPKYHIGRQLSQISEGPSNGSNRLAICELRQSKTRPVTKSAFLLDYTFLYKTRFWPNFSMTPREFVYKKCRQQTQLSAGYSYDSFQHTVWSLQIF
jgi:hypothetical protein